MKKFLVLLLFLPILAGINTVSEGYRVTFGGGTKRIYLDDGTTQGICYSIQNNHATSDLFVPTQSLTEWNSFLTNTPGFATKTLCYPKSCLEIKNLKGAPADGYYTIDSDGVGGNASYSAYCDMTLDGGGWTRIFHHHIQGGYFTSVASATSMNVGTPSADLYSVLDKIPDFVTNGKYRFRENWPGYTKKNIWIQSTNPMSDVVTSGVVAIAVQAYDDSRQNYWGGLELGNGTHGPGNNNSSLLDGSVQHSNWYHAIGQTLAWGSPPGIPADHAISSGGVSETVLWIKDDSTVTSYNSCKDILDSGASYGSGLYTIDPGSAGSPLQVYCDMTSDGGGWTRVFYHTASGTLFVNNAEALNSNQTQPLNTTKYSILNRVSGFLRAGKYEMKMDWPASGSSKRNWWTQTNNFVSTTISGYASVSVQAIANGWGGLEPNADGVSLADGTVGSGGWYYAVGSQVLWGTNNPGIPSADDIVAVDTGVPRVEVWIK